MDEWKKRKNKRKKERLMSGLEYEKVWDNSS